MGRECFSPPEKPQAGGLRADGDGEKETTRAVGLGRCSCPFGELVQQRRKYRHRDTSTAVFTEQHVPEEGAGGAPRSHQEGNGVSCAAPAAWARVIIAGDAV